MHVFYCHLFNMPLLKLSNLFLWYSRTCSKQLLCSGSVVIWVAKSLISFAPLSAASLTSQISAPSCSFHCLPRCQWSSEPVTFISKSIKHKVRLWPCKVCEDCSCIDDRKHWLPFLVAVWFLLFLKTRLLVSPWQTWSCWYVCWTSGIRYHE